MAKERRAFLKIVQGVYNCEKNLHATNTQRKREELEPKSTEAFKQKSSSPSSLLLFHSPYAHCNLEGESPLCLGSFTGSSTRRFGRPLSGCSAIASLLLLALPCAIAEHLSAEPDLRGFPFRSDLIYPEYSDLPRPGKLRDLVPHSIRVASPRARHRSRGNPPRSGVSSSSSAKMGISSLPAPSEGVLTLLLVNTALSISLIKEIVRSLLHVVGLNRGDPDASPPRPAVGESFAELFRSRATPVRFGARQPEEGKGGHAEDCRVCLTRFEPESMVNRLPCGHLFHKGCLEKWLDYHHVTCPLCRTHLLPLGDSPSWPCVI
ncbi:hypothetical protein Taro_045202 [Colocasia esculenta]|uniref:RING-type domain-containing protein n=1 Tax=Colocasia esculenta TaxID=4460 RepID=A0A843WWG4_COLES|nr:hypothetical protein [Colocasia esculenta]